MNKLKQFFSIIPPWWSFVVLLLVGGIVIWLAPAEATLGDGIKPVYVHVPLTLVAKFLLYLTVGLGVATVFWPQRFAQWTWATFRVGYWMFLTGFLFSVLSSKINWGNVPLQEPRFLKAINVLVVGLAVWVLIRLVSNVRVQGLMLALPPLFFLTLSKPSTWVLHPETAMRTAPGGIGTTFFVMILWAILLAGLWLWYLWRSAFQAEVIATE